MSRWLRGLAAGSLAAAFLLGAVPASALDDARIAQALKAGDDFLALARPAPTGAKPRASDPAVGALLAKVFDRGALGSGPIPVTQAGPVGQLLANANRVGFVYYLDGTGAADLSEMNPSRSSRADANVAKYPSELGDWLDYLMAIQLGLVGGMLDFSAQATPEIRERPNVRKVFEDVRGSMKRATSNLLDAVALPGLTDDWRLARLGLVMRGADTLVRFLEPPQRLELRDKALQVEARTNDPTLKGQLAAFARQVAPKSP